MFLIDLIRAVIIQQVFPGFSSFFSLCFSPGCIRVINRSELKINQYNYFAVRLQLIHENPFYVAVH